MNQINDIIHLLIERSGLLFEESKYPKAAAFVSDRMRIVGQSSHSTYLEYLKSPPGAGELDAFIAAFSVGETYFFRNHNHWETFRKVVLPDILRKNRANRSLRFWSAGCSSGEEPYTLVICLWDNLVFPPHWDIRIVATDVNQEAL
jgi:chemotaxis protein methyltransferase CheR